MGTNFYLFTKNKKYKKILSCLELVDEPDFGYMLHIGKRSGGWLPLFEAHGNEIRSIADYKRLYDTSDFKIFDEYDRELTWKEFEDQLLSWYGGVDGAVPKSKFKYNFGTDANPILLNTPASHIEFSKHDKLCRYFKYFKDPQGYEFIDSEFS